MLQKPAEPVELTKISTEDLEFVLSMIYDRIIDKVDKLVSRDQDAVTAVLVF